MITRDIIDIAMQPGLSELKLHLRITSNDQDALLTSYLKAAAMSAEHYIGRCLEDSRFVLTDSFSPVITLGHVNPQFFPVKGEPRVYMDGTACTDFTLDGNRLVFGGAVTGGAVRVEYTAGGGRVESDIRTAILLTASKYFNNPVDSVETLPSVATNLLSQYRAWEVNDAD